MDSFRINNQKIFFINKLFLILKKYLFKILIQNNAKII